MLHLKKKCCFVKFHCLIKDEHLMFFPPDAPATPTLTYTAEDGFTCATTTSEATSYEFRRFGEIVSTSSVNTYKMSSMTRGSTDGVYTCVAYFHTVVSASSQVQTIACEFFLESSSEE